MTTTEVVRTKADLARFADLQRKRIEHNSGQHFSDPEWEESVRPAILDDTIERLPERGQVTLDWSEVSVSLMPTLSGFKEPAATADPEIVRNNPDLGREIDRRRSMIGRLSAWRFTDAEWDRIRPAIVTAIIENLPLGDRIYLGDPRISVSRPVKRKQIHIERSPDGSSTATITETGQ